ncbi:hypothetical protein BCR39DRAFT_560940 [Naematelia encephala]|uniref:Uncharacterized protein n=1 Tax=Naematelia encephala TaxID=71784 RepID=A0A1Y2ASU7_9TREE|nr:hypothetical protein BCR39DRAFT_560940 [Naematelia encephala]
MSGQILWGKWALFSTATVTPTEEQLYDRLAPDLKRKVDELRRQREASSPLKERLTDPNSQDQIVWADSLGNNNTNKLPPGTSRRV